MHATLCDYAADIVQNSIEASADMVELQICTGDGDMKLTVRDNGKGMTREVMARAMDPFWSEPGKHCARKVGLGLPFLQQVAEQTGGNFSVESEPGAGTTVMMSLPEGHWDTPPLGDVAAAVTGLLSFAGSYELLFNRRHGMQEYEISRNELAEALGGLERADELAMAHRYLKSQEEGLLGSTRENE